MKQGSDLRQLVEEIERRRSAKKDFVAPRGALTLVAETGGPRLRVGDAADVALNSVAHGQLASVLDIPKTYYDRMLAERPELLVENVNTWFRKDPEKGQMVRTLDNVGRAILSDKFRVSGLEYEDLAEAALPALIESEAEIMSAQVTDTRLYIKAVDLKIVRDLAKAGGAFGDGKHVIVSRPNSPAVTISTSEVGMGAASVLQGLFDSACSNLALFKERAVRKYHVGARHEFGDDVSELLTDETKVKEAVALKAMLADVVRGAFDRARFDALVDKVEGTVRDKLTGDPVKVVELVRKKMTLTVEEGNSVLRNLIEGGSLTRFGLYNAVTAASQTVEDYDRATELERMGGNIIELPASEWRVIAEAA